MEEMKNIMTRAWEIAREAVEKFGGQAAEYISGSLKQAWAETKNDFQLQGSEKQVAWAEEIREAYVAKVAEYLELKEKEEKVTGEITALEIRVHAQSLRSKINKVQNKKVREFKKTFEGTREEKYATIRKIKSAHANKLEKVIERKINATLRQTSASFWINEYKGLV